MKTPRDRIAEDKLDRLVNPPYFPNADTPDFRKMTFAEMLEYNREAMAEWSLLYKAVRD